MQLRFMTLKIFYNNFLLKLNQVLTVLINPSVHLHRLQAETLRFVERGTWQSGSEQTLPTADSSVPFLVPQNLQASELLDVGLPTKLLGLVKIGIDESPENAASVEVILSAY